MEPLAHPVLPRIATSMPSSRSQAGALPQAGSELDKLSLRLQKAEKALEHERAHTEALRHQVETLRARAEVGAHAESTIAGLRAQLAAMTALAAQRTAEGEALQRAVRLGDETAARLRQQLEGLLQANQVAVAREHDLERQMDEVTRRLAEQAAQHEAALAAAVGQPGGTEALQRQLDYAGLENARLAAALEEQGAALAHARAECARKDAGIRALEALLAQHGMTAVRPATPRSPPPSSSPPPLASPRPPRELADGRQLPRGEPQPSQPGAPLPSTVTIDILMGDVAEGARAGAGTDSAAAAPATALEPLTGGLTDSQWKLVMLSNEVRRLRVAIAARRSAVTAANAGGSASSPPGAESLVAQLSNGLGRDDVVEVDLPAKEVKARVAQLAQQMQDLEEELQGLGPGQQGQGSLGGDAHSRHSTVASTPNGHAHMHVRDGGEGRQAQGAGLGPAVALPAGHASQTLQGEGGPGVPIVSKKARRRGWLAWLVRPRDDSIV